jgi:hypothetical protein
VFLVWMALVTAAFWRSARHGTAASARHEV